MATDPAFLFYPGDYLRDTQCLSEKPQVAYDRIMCEHMRNIVITQERLEFFTKRLDDDEKEELAHVLLKVEGGFMIAWVAESISKRKAYGASRRQNRSGKGKKHVLNTSSTYVPHMENENENTEVKDVKGGVGELPDRPVQPTPIVQVMANAWIKAKPDYPIDQTTDFTALFDIGQFLADQLKGRWLPETDVGRLAILGAWDRLAAWIAADDFYRSWALAQMSRTKNLQTIWQKSKETKNATAAIKSNSGNRKDAGAQALASRLGEKLAARGTPNVGG